MLRCRTGTGMNMCTLCPCAFSLLQADGLYGLDEEEEEDEEEVERQEQFEAEYNFRFQEPGGASIVSHPR